jgi:hypothetical protein
MIAGELATRSTAPFTVKCSSQNEINDDNEAAKVKFWKMKDIPMPHQLHSLI